MKNKRKLWIAVMCCVLIIGLSATAFAIGQETFFIQKCGGKRVTGTGILDTYEARSVMSAKSIPGEPQQMDEMYSSYVRIDAYDTAGERYSGSYNTGDVYVTTSCKIDSRTTRAEYTYRFNGTELGMYPLYYGQ